MRFSQKLFQFQEFIDYWLAQEDEHSLQPPFIFDFYKKIICKDDKPGFPELEKLRAFLKNDKTLIDEQALGAGSAVLNTKRRVCDIAKHGLTTPKYAKLLTRLARSANASTIIELGTSLGLQSLYFSSSCPESSIYTLEGNAQLVKIAQQLFKDQKAHNVSVITGNIDDSFPALIDSLDKVDFIYIDANHRKLPTLSYFYLALKKCRNGSILVIDDIHWSSEMKKAWLEIIDHPDTSVTIDLFQMGVVIIKPDLPKQHWVLTF